MCLCFEVEPFQTSYYRIFPNFATLVILLQINLVSGDGLKIIYKVFYEIEDTSIFAWSLIPNVGHDHWLCSSICRLPLLISRWIT